MSKHQYLGIRIPIEENHTLQAFKKACAKLYKSEEKLNFSKKAKLYFWAKGNQPKIGRRRSRFSQREK